MASGEEEVALEETGTPRTRSTRTVSVKKAARGRKKAAASPRATRSKRSTRSSQPPESEEEEDDETQSELNQDASENATAESMEECVTEYDNIGEDNVVSEDNIPEEDNALKDDKTKDGNASESGDEVQEEGGMKNEKEQIKLSEVDGKGDEQKNVNSDAKSKLEPQEGTKQSCENGREKSGNDCQNKIKVEKNEETNPDLKKTGAGDGIKEIGATEENIKKENGEQSDSSEAAEIKQEGRSIKKELEDLNQPEASALSQKIKNEKHASSVQTVEEAEFPEKIQVESASSKVELGNKTVESDSKTDSKSKTVDSESKTESKSKTVGLEDKTESKSKTVDSENTTVESKNKITDSESKPVKSKNEAINSESKKVESKNKTVESKSKTAESESKTVKPENKTVKSESKPVKPESKPVKSESKPVKSERKPVKLESKTVESESKAEMKEERMDVDEDTIEKGTEETTVKDEIKSKPTIQKKFKEKKVKVKEEAKENENMEVVNEKIEDSAIEKENQDEDNRTAEDDVENMTVIDEVTDESAVQEQMEKEDKSNVEGQSPFPTEPDTEMVSEDELPTESSKEPLETEAVSDEELPEPAAPVDLPETEAVSEDELPPEKVEKKKKKKAAPTTKVADSSGTGAEGETNKKKVRSTEAQKRKMMDGDTYDPSSPTSENSCDETPAAKRAAVSSATGSVQAKPVTKTRKALPELEKYWKAVKEDPSDFTGWTYLLQYVDQENDIEAAREAYDAFLSHYPYCYGYWRKYADYEKRKGNKEKCEEVFERGLKAIPLSVDLWIHFLNYSKATYPDDEEHLRTQFEKAINACGMEFRSDRLWESYIKWETEGKRLQNVTALYDRLLAMPTQGYTNHFDNFQEHIASNPPQKVLSVDEFLTLRREVLQQLKQYDTPTTVDDAVPGEEVEAPPGEEPEEQPLVKTDEETTALRERIISIRRKVHKATVSAVADRWNFEEGIKRPYFHVKPLERCQLKNWKEYLDYEIEQGDQERIVVLFERCLIACALYEEFWIKFVRYLESIKGEDVTDKIRNVYERACTIHHTKKPNLHLHWAVFEESHKNYEKASEILNNLEKLIPNMLQVAYRRINLERRRNNMDKVCALYEHYISNTKNKVISNNMAIKYARFCWKVKGDVDKAIGILNKAVEKDKDNPRLYLQLIDMGLQKSPLNEEEIVTIIDLFLGRDTDPEQKVLFAQRKVEFLEDFGSDIVSVQKAHDEFQRYFKQAKDRKKKSPDLDKSAESASSSKKAKSLSTGGDGTPLHSHTSPQTAHSATGQQAAQASATAAASASQYQATTYNQTGGYSQQAQAQGGYQGSQYPPTGPQQPPTPYNQPPYNQQYGQSSDPNYANYQNWGYSQTGYGGYNQGWGNYNYY